MATKKSRPVQKVEDFLSWRRERVLKEERRQAELLLALKQAQEQAKQKAWADQIRKEHQKAKKKAIKKGVSPPVLLQVMGKDTDRMRIVALESGHRVIVDRAGKTIPSKEELFNKRSQASKKGWEARRMPLVPGSTAALATEERKKKEEHTQALTNVLAEARQDVLKKGKRQEELVAAMVEAEKQATRKARKARTQVFTPIVQGEERVSWGKSRDVFKSSEQAPTEVSWGDEYAARTRLRKEVIEAMPARATKPEGKKRKQRPVLSKNVQGMNEGQFSAWLGKSKASLKNKERYEREWKAGKKAIYGTNYRVIVEGVDDRGDRVAGPFVYDSSTARWTQKRKDEVLAELKKEMKEDYDVQMVGIRILGTYGKMGEMRVPV